MNKDKFLDELKNQIELNDRFLRLASEMNDDEAIIKRAAVVGTLEAIKFLVEQGRYDKEEVTV